MKRAHMLGAGALLVCLGTVQPCQAEEELAPGFDACMEKSGGVTVEMRMCLDQAYKYWDAELNGNYSSAMNRCNDTDDPKACKNRLCNAERLWVQYKEAMSDAIMGYEDGTMGPVLGADFLARETKKQALELGGVSGDGE